MPGCNWTTTHWQSRLPISPINFVRPPLKILRQVMMKRFIRIRNLVSALTVFFRPLSVLQLIAEVIGGHMAQRFGPPPEGLP